MTKTPGRILYDELASAVAALPVFDRLALAAAIQKTGGYDALPVSAKTALEVIAERRP